MGGELGILISHVSVSSDMVRPYGYYSYPLTNPSMDLTLHSEDGQFLHICGDNDWGYLAVDILIPLLKEASKIYNEICNKVVHEQPEVILVGKNEFRMLDILHMARGCGEHISIIKGVPVVKGNFDNGVKYYGKEKSLDESLPFK